MTDEATRTEYPLEPLGPDRSEWAKRVSQDIEELSREAARLLERLELRFGPEAFRSPRFLASYLRLAQSRGMMRVFEVVYMRAIRVREISGFEGRFRASVEAVGKGTPHDPDSVPLDLAYYLPQAVEQANVQREEGLLPDSSPAVLLVEFAAAALDDAGLLGFRIDLSGSTPSQSRPSLVGRLFPPYQLVELLGSGGFAEVYRARHATLNVDRALKFLRRTAPTPLEIERLRSGLVQEAQVQAGLDHPNVVRLLDVGDHEGFIFLVMDYVLGKTLAQLIHEKTLEGSHLSPLRIVELAIEVLSGLEYAHARGIVHRDIKPENILIDDHGRVRIVDFGLARIMEESGQQRHSRTGYLLGTPQYMAPEQVGGRGEAYDHRSDLYSFGVVLYAMALGAPPFSDPDVWAVLRMHREEKPASLIVQVEGFPEELDRIVQKCLEKRPEDRYASATELMTALERCRENLLRAGEVDRRSTRRTRRAGLLVGGALVAATLFALLAIPLWKGTPVDKAAPPSVKAEAPSKSAGEVAGVSPPSRAVPKEEAKEEKGGKKAELLRRPEGLPRADSPSSKVPEPEAAAARKLTAPPLRDKLIGYLPTEGELLFVRDLLELFSKHHPELLSKSYGPLRADLEGFERDRLGVPRDAEPPPGKEYQAAHLRAACRMVDLAEGALQARLEELRSSKEKVSLALTDGTTKSGTVERVEEGVVTLASTDAGKVRLTIASIVPESLKGEAAPASAQLALLALSGSVGAGFQETVDLAGSRDDLLFWIPVVARLGRLEVEEAAKAAALAKKEGPSGSEKSAQTEGLCARVASLATMLAKRKDGILRLFSHTRPDFDIAEREAEALRLLIGEEYARVLALGPGTAAFPVAAESLLERFQTEVEAAHDELHGRTGWHGYNWGLFPPEKSLKDQEKYWDPDPEGNGTILQADQIERRIAMGKGAKRAPEGVLIRLTYLPKAGAQPAPHWRFLVRSPEGAPNYLRFDDGSCALFRTRLESGSADLEIARSSLPSQPKAGQERAVALMPLDGTLHVFVDGRHVLAVPEAEAKVPMQLSFSITQGRAWIKTVKVKKSPVEEDHK